MMDIAHTCCFTGHRPEALFAHGEDETGIFLAVSAAVGDAVCDGYTDFLCGGSRGGDMIFADAVIAAREAHPSVKLHCILPCRNQSEKWSADDRSRYADMLDAADSVVCLSERYHTGCMQMRNRYMVERSSLLIAAYYRGQSGGTGYTVKYAKRRGLRTVSLLTAPAYDSNQLSLL